MIGSVDKIRYQRVMEAKEKEMKNKEEMDKKASEGKDKEEKPSDKEKDKEKEPKDKEMKENISEPSLSNGITPYKSLFGEKCKVKPSKKEEMKESIALIPTLVSNVTIVLTPVDNASSVLSHVRALPEVQSAEIMNHFGMKFVSVTFNSQKELIMFVKKYLEI